MKGAVMYVLSWAVAVVLATAVGLAAVSTVGDALRGRGPLGGEVRPSERRPLLDTDAVVVSRDISGDFGTFVVSCQGVYAIGQQARADTTDGWRVVRFETGPDNDLDAVFSSRHTQVDLEVFCNDGEPTVGEIERSQLPVGER